MALYFACLSAAAYLAKEFVGKWATTEQGYTGSKFIENGHAQAYFFEDSASIVLAFRGSDNAADWDDNFKNKFRTEPCSDTHGCVHAGFKRHLDLIWDEIVTEINSGARQEKRLWICGHSLGGALATLAASRFTTLFDRPVASCFTYGAPRVGNYQWASAQRFRLYRIVNKNDFVPTVPWPVTGWRHYGVEWYLSCNDEVFEFFPSWRRNLDQFVRLLVNCQSFDLDHW
ncbi:unnamed protein product, partial [Heterosigma akashiwo]